MKIIDGKKLQKEILVQVKHGVSALPFQPIFCDILVGEDAPSVQYVKMKKRMAESVGIKFHSASFPAEITTQELIKEIKILNKVKNMCGIIVQLPLPISLDKRAVLDAIEPHLDVDYLGAIASEEFYNSFTSGIGGFPAALACMVLLDSINLDLKDKKIVVLGQGELVGRPVAALLKRRGINPLVITRETENTEELLKEADIIISGIGHGKYITGDMVKNGVVLIDAGTSESLGHSPMGKPNGGIIGDVDLESVAEVASYISPVPGGVGPVTVAMLLQNVLLVAQNLISYE